MATSARVTSPARAPEFGARWRALLAYTLLTLLVTLTVALPIVGAWRGTSVAVDGFGSLDLFAGQLTLAAFLALWFVLQQRDSWRVFFALPAGNWAVRIATGARVGLVGWLVTLAAMALLGVLTSALGIEARPGFTEVVRWIATRPLWLRVLLVVAAMTTEEAFFRAFLQARLGLTLATLCFALGHLNYGSPAMGGGVFVIGLVLGLAYRRHRDLAVCAVAHGVFDAIQLLIVLPLVAREL